MNAKDLQVGDSLQLLSGSKIVLSEKTRIDTLVTVYNFAVSDFSTYYVGEQGILVHNNNPCAQVAKKIVSVVKNDPKLLKLVEEAFAGNKELRDEANGLINQLSKGNMNPGIGTKNIGKSIFEARGRKGARVYFRNTSDGIEIIGYSNKENQTPVINRLFQLY